MFALKFGSGKPPKKKFKYVDNLEDLHKLAERAKE